MTLRQVIEALLFASAKPLTVEEVVAALQAAGEKVEEGFSLLKDLASSTPEQVHDALQMLRGESERAERGFVLTEQINGWVFTTHPDTAPWVRRLYPEAKPTRLSGPALETLAIIAYRQPVTRADVEAVRGVAVDGVMQVLLDRQLVKIAGRAEVPGRPLLYSTTEYFLQHFGLKQLTELPNAAELKRMPLPKAPPPEEKPEKPAKGKKKAEAAPAPTAEAAPTPAAVVEEPSLAAAAAASTLEETVPEAGGSEPAPEVVPEAGGDGSSLNAAFEAPADDETHA